MNEPKRYLDQHKRPSDTPGTWYNPVWVEWAMKQIDDLYKSELPFIKFEPSSDYGSLRRQAISLHQMLEARGQMTSYWQEKALGCDQSVIDDLKEQIESEKEMNAQLTRELM